jgi:hypothetical protein
MSAKSSFPATKNFINNILQNGGFNQSIGTGFSLKLRSNGTNAGITRAYDTGTSNGYYAVLPEVWDLFQRSSDLSNGKYTLTFDERMPLQLQLI